MKKTAVLIVAAGRGNRFGGELPKQYQELCGRMILSHSLATFKAHPAINTVQTVINPDDIKLYNIAAEGLLLPPPVSGGIERQDSVRNGLLALEKDAPDYVLIHDGARPLADFTVISNVIDALADNIGAIPALPVTDTLKKSYGTSQNISKTVKRDNLWRVQTPQGFRYKEILEAHKLAEGKNSTDDAAVAENAGLKIVLTEGSRNNIKITSPEDLERATFIIKNARKTKTGFGYDVHKFADNENLILGGITIPYEKGLAGHSDADVVLHALTDALLGSVGAGDIGVHFPPSDDRWKGVSSDTFVKYAVNVIRAMGGTISNIDITIICEAPKIGRHRFSMLKNIAAITGIPQQDINIKGTTTEGLGFAGRGEGIAAHACATVDI